MERFARSHRNRTHSFSVGPGSCEMGGTFGRGFCDVQERPRQPVRTIGAETSKERLGLFAAHGQGNGPQQLLPPRQVLQLHVVFG